MQAQSFSNTSPWIHAAYLLLAGILASGAAWFTAWRNRRKPEAEIHESLARADSLRLGSSAAAGEALARMMERLDEALDNAERVRDERDMLKVQTQKQEIELRLNDVQIQKLKALLILHGIKYSEFDEPKG